MLSERILRRRAAGIAASKLKADMSLFPHWLYPGSLAIPEGVRRRVELARINDPVPDERVDEPLHFGSVK